MSVDSDPDIGIEWLRLGQLLADARKAAGYTQETFAPLTNFGRSTVANVERGRQRIGREFWQSCDQLLRTDGALTAEYERIRRAVGKQRTAALDNALATAPLFTLSGRREPAVQPAVLAPLSQPDGTIAGSRPPVTFDHYLWVPPGRSLPGLAIPAQLHHAVLNEHAVTYVPAAYAQDPFIQRPGRALVVGRTEDPESAAFVLDSRHARRRLRGAGDDARLLIPRAYRLDGLTFALLWAVANYDEALLADDAVIVAGLSDSTGYALMSRSAASRDMAADASAASRMWLGSQFCADHIRRHASSLTDTPVFWTQERRGEEAATWLLFTHKHDYLKDTSERSRPDSGEAIMRAFCIPHEAVTASPAGERALLLLAVALMESYGIHTAITDAPELAGTAGFVTDRRRRAITATWVGADGIWYVDLADDQGTLRTYRDTAGYAASNSVIAAPTTYGRLRNFATYLDLDWQWLTTRCAELAEHGTAGIVQPRSRLLSVAGVDRACQFVAETDRRAD